MRSGPTGAGWIPRVVVAALLTAAFAGCEGSPGDQEEECGTEDVEDATILESNHDSFQLLTPDADKDCHAYFTLIFGWVNQARSADQNEPGPHEDLEVDLRTTFRTRRGLFYAPTPVKELWPGRGWCWRIEFDEGAKNEPSNPTDYQIWAESESLVGLNPPIAIPDYYSVWIEARIVYSPWSEPTK